MNATIHIFSYGEAQIISEAVNFKTSINKFTKLQAVIDNIKSKKPVGKTAADYHAINIFGDLKVDYISKRDEAKPKDEDKSSFSVDFKDVDATKLNALIAEFGTLSKA